MQYTKTDAESLRNVEFGTSDLDLLGIHSFRAHVTLTSLGGSMFRYTAGERFDWPIITTSTAVCMFVSLIT